MSGPKLTVPTSATRMGVPVLRSTPSAIWRKSSRLFTYPRPRTKYSRPDISITRPPTSALLRRMAADTSASESP